MERVQARAYETVMYAFSWIVLNVFTTHCAMSTEVHLLTVGEHYESLVGVQSQLPEDNVPKGSKMLDVSNL
eukprot:3643965-Pleurochrysis_carterae.AAC.1